MMPELDGISTCKRIKSSPKKDIPVLILTAKDTDDDQIEALEAGADDYISKPFSFPILLLRVKSLLKRVLSNEETLKVNDVEVDVQKHTVKSKDELVELTPKEFELLVLLMRNKNNVITRESILEQIWGYDYFGDNRTVDTHIKNLRIKIKDENLIKTVRGYGYVINE
jgi:two-component system alkaline phosphatase synthesis response regulator PhoP